MKNKIYEIYIFNSPKEQNYLSKIHVFSYQNIIKGFAIIFTKRRESFRASLNFLNNKKIKIKYS